MRLDVKADRTHELQRIAFAHDAGAQAMVEHRSPVFGKIFEVKVLGTRSQDFGNVCQGGIVRSQEPDRPSLNQVLDERFRADGSIVGVCAVQKLIEEKEQRQRPRRDVDELPQAGNLRIESGNPAWSESVFWIEAPAETGASLSLDARTGAPASARTALVPTVRSRVLLPDMLEPLTTRTRRFSLSLTPFLTQVAPGSGG